MSVPLPLAGQSALITGASRGIGAACARALAASGARVVLVARDAAALQALAAECGHGAAVLTADLAVPSAAAEVAAAAVALLGRAPDIIVHSAGSFPISALDAVSDSELDLALALNVAAPLRLTRAFLGDMRVRGGGHVVTIGSVSDRVVYPSNSVYTASKHAVRAVHETLRAETRGSGVRATLISPAATDTAIWDPHDPDRSPHLPSRSEMLRPEDVADAVAWAVTRPAHVDVEELRLARS
ncbi:MAG: SDR family NAD(P)-dependent oxidoreductase [Gemmatimonadetes bacterium]|nr:SDR family NAD(P)-dependent oxidoreductase [Gemmatimonadota bacterium]